LQVEELQNSEQDAVSSSHKQRGAIGAFGPRRRKRFHSSLQTFGPFRGKNAASASELKSAFLNGALRVARMVSAEQEIYYGRLLV
jgi:hypothetical protein